jgi:ABC-2 type transport system permease protein
MLSSLVAVIAYSALFLGLGLLVRRALTWGLAYVLIWEGFVARSGTGPARLSILVYARSLLADLAKHQAPTSGASFTVAVAVPLVVGLVAVAATTWLLRRLDVK